MNEPYDPAAPRLMTFGDRFEESFEEMRARVDAAMGRAVRYQDLLAEYDRELPPDDYFGRYQRAMADCYPFVLSIREPLVKRYAFAVPNDAALDALARLGPIVEMGAGTGYWAMLLRRRGVDIQAYDKAPGDSNHYRFTQRWTGVLHGRPGKLKHRADRALFLCWPDYASSFAADCLRCYTGDVLAYIGEIGGCTGDDAFGDMLESEWTIDREVVIPQWSGVHDALYICKRARG